MARIVFLLSILLLLTPAAFADSQVVQGLVSSDQTYIVNDEGESVKESQIGDTVFLVVDSKQDKKRKDFYRVTFDPTNLQGDGWILKDKVKLMTGYRSVDGKEPKEYENQPQNVVVKKQTTSQGLGVQSTASTEASTFLEELIKKDEAAPELKPVTDQPKAAVPVKKEENNALQNDLEFLFKEDGEFKKTYDNTKAAVKNSMQKKIAVSKLSATADVFATSVLDQFVAQLQKNTQQTPISKLQFVSNLDDASSLKNAAIPKDLDGVFFGQISPKIGDGRLLKIKYYDQKLQQFTFEKVAKIPLVQPAKTVEKLANDCYQFLSK